jgi:hypothetical protein
MVKVLILTPVKDATSHLDRYFANLAALDPRGLTLSLGMLESDSEDPTFDHAQRGMATLDGRFARTGLWRKPFGYRLPPGVPRWSHEHQIARRSVLARSRNHLLFHALDDEDWVLWLDVDVIQYPPDLIQRLLTTGKPIVHPHCVLCYGGRTFDQNAWAGQPPRTMDAMRQEGPLVPLDAVGGSCLLVKADLHRDGLIFPPFLYGRASPAARTPGPWAPLPPGEIETEGLGLMARDMGEQCWGLPTFEILHADR